MTDTTERPQLGSSFWLFWVLASAVGMSLGLVVSFFMTFGYSMSGGLDVLGEVVLFAVTGALAGASLGIPQWLVLRRQVSRVGWWVLASSVGLAVGLAVAGVVIDGFKVALVLRGAMATLALGASLGVAQWFVLRRQVSMSGWWVLVSTVGLGVGLALVAVGAGGGTVVDILLVLLIFGVMGGAIFGATTGAGMVWLWRQPVRLEPSPAQDAAESEGESEELADNHERAQVGWRFWLWRFWLWWMLASTVGYVAAFNWTLELADPILEALDGIVGEVPNPIFWALMGALIGVTIGAAQWFVLRKQVSRAGWWVLASVLGGFVGGFLLREASLLFFGVSLGIAQGIVMFLWRGSPALLWVLASVVAISLASTVGGVVSNVALEIAMAGAPRSPSEAGSFFGTFGSTYRLPLSMLRGFIYAAISGVSVVWLMRLPARKKFTFLRDVGAAEDNGRPTAEEPGSSQEVAATDGEGELINDEPSLAQEAADLEDDAKALPGTDERPQVGQRFWIAWVVASTVGLVVGGFVPLTWPFASSMILTPLARLWIALGGALAGASLGIAQALPLQWRKADWSGWWAMATTIGMSVGWVVASFTGGGFRLGMLQEESVGLGAAVVLVGISLGIAQWPVLRGRVQRASWWVLASIVGSAMSAVALVIGWENPLQTKLPSGLYFEVMTNALQGLVPIILYFTTMGGVMVWLSRQPLEEQASVSQDIANLDRTHLKWAVWALMGAGTLALILFFPAQSGPRAQARAHVHLGNQARSESEELAIEEYTNAIALDPELVNAYTMRGDLYGRMGDVNRAIADLEMAISLDPENFHAYSSLADLYAREGDVNRAIANLEKAIALDLNNVRTHSNLSKLTDLYVREGDLNRAIASLERAIALDPENVRAYSNLADLYAREGKFEQAITQIGRAIELNQVVERGSFPEGTLEAQLERIEAMRDMAMPVDSSPETAFLGSATQQLDPEALTRLQASDLNLALGQPATASNSLPDEPPSNAVNDEFSSWNAGGHPPQWIEIELPSASAIKAIRLHVAQHPPGETYHRVLVQLPDSPFQLAHQFVGHTKDPDILLFEADPPLVGVSAIRIETLDSPSWVAWREIEVIGIPLVPGDSASTNTPTAVPNEQYVTDLEMLHAEVGHGEPSMGEFNFTTAGVAQGDPILSHGTNFRHGIHAHANSRYEFVLGGHFSELSSSILMLDRMQCGDGTVFVVKLDGEEAFRSPIIRYSSDPTTINVDVSGAQRLELLTEMRANADCDWSIWGDPTVYR